MPKMPEALIMLHIYICWPSQVKTARYKTRQILMLTAQAMSANYELQYLHRRISHLIFKTIV